MKKILIVFMIFVVLFSSSFFLIPQKSYALGFDTALKIAVGSSAKQIVRGLGEEVGLHLAGKQLDNAVGYINKRAADGDVKAINFVQDVNAKTGTSIPTRTGWKKYILDPINWLTGLDLLFAFISAFKSASDSGQPFVTKCYPEVVLQYDKALTKTVFSLIYQGNVVSTDSIVTSGYVPISGHPVIDQVKFNTVNEDFVSFHYLFTTTNGYDFSNWDHALKKNGTTLLNDCSSVATSGDVPDVTNVNNTIINNFNNDTYVTNSTYNVSIDAPDNTFDNSTTVWNDVDVNIVNEIAPPPDSDGDGIPDADEPDSDGDGIPDDNDSTPTKPGDGSDGTNPFASLVPIIFLIKLFGLLGACLSYTGRLLAFVMTIPLIPSKTIDNTAFQWFRDARIVGIQIYTVVSSMASIGLSFLVYRVIRRLF